MITRVTEITEICTKQDMSRWTRAHADAPGITWSVYPGPGGTMIIVEHAENRASLGAVHASPEAATASDFAARAPVAASDFAAHAPVAAADRGAHAPVAAGELGAHGAEVPARTAGTFTARQSHSAHMFA